jgi:hypothetical protein
MLLLMLKCCERKTLFVHWKMLRSSPEEPDKIFYSSCRQRRAFLVKEKSRRVGPATVVAAAVVSAAQQMSARGPDSGQQPRARAR